MTNQSANRDTFRQGGYEVELYVSFIIAESTVLQGTVSSTPSDPALAITFTTDSGSYLDVLEDMEVEFFDSTLTTSKGRVRVASGGASAGSLQIEEVSAGRVDIALNDKFKVYREWRVRPKLVGADASFKKDSRITYANQNSVIKPIANAGGPRVAFADSGVASFQLNGTQSFTVDDDSAGTLTYLWDVRSQTITSGGTGNNQLAIDAATGLYWMSLTVTDTSNSASEVKYFPVLVEDRDPANWAYTYHADPNSLQLSATRQGGWRASFDMLEDVDMDAAPDGCAVLIWCVERFNGTEISYRDTGNVLFFGWLERDNNERDGLRAELEFEASGTIARMEQLPGFSQVLQQVSSPANWQEYESPLDTRDVILYLIRWHTTALTVCDYIHNGNVTNYPSWFIQAQTPLGQVREVCAAQQSFFTSLRDGSLMIDNVENLLTTDVARGLVTTTLVLTERDVLRYRFTREHNYPINRVEARGFTTGFNSPIFAQSPGAAPASAPGQTVIERLIASSQSELNKLCGRYFALENSLYDNLPAPAVEVELLPSYDVFDVDQAWVSIDMAESLDRRDTGLDTRAVIESINVSYFNQDGSVGGRIALQLQAETDGPDGAFYVPPPENQNGLPDFDLPEFDFPEFDYTDLDTGEILTLERGIVSLIAFNTDGYVYEFSDWNNTAASGGPIVSRISLTSAGMSGTLLQAVVDPWSPAYLGTGANVNGWLVTTTHIYRWQYNPSTPSITIDRSYNDASLGGTSSFRQISTERALQNFVCVASYLATGTVLHYSTDGGTTWGSQTITANVHTPYNNDGWRPGLSVDPTTSGRVWVAAMESTNVGSLYRVDSSGAGTPSLYGSDWFQESTAMFLHQPYANPTQFYHAISRGTNLNDFGRNGATLITLSFPLWIRSVHSQDSNANNMCMVGQEEVDQNGVVLITNNGWASYTEIVAPTSDYRGCSVASYNQIYLWGENGTISLWNGSVVEDKRGNIPDDFPSAATFVNIMGVG